MREHDSSTINQFSNSLFFLFLPASSLTVTPPSINEPEGDEEVHFFCLENDNGNQATGVTWRDPQGHEYTPGSTASGGNPRILAEGYRLSVLELNRNDTGSYECFRGESESAEAQLFVYGMI